MSNSKVKVQIDSVEDILLKRKLNKNGDAQKFLEKEIVRLSDSYIPMDSGKLKDSAKAREGKIIYEVPYANAQYYKNKGKGLRGKHWTTRMWADRGTEVVKSLKNLVGGK